jgi:hypothetical protein
MINLIWEYSQSIWDNRNKIVHGYTLEETKAKEVEAAQKAITMAYEEYDKDHFIIPSHLHYLFTSRSLTQRLNDCNRT